MLRMPSNSYFQWHFLGSAILFVYVKDGARGYLRRLPAVKTLKAFLSIGRVVDPSQMHFLLVSLYIYCLSAREIFPFPSLTQII